MSSVQLSWGPWHPTCSAHWVQREWGAILGLGTQSSEFRDRIPRAALLGMSHLQELPTALISLTPPRSALSCHLFGTREVSVALLTAAETDPVGITMRSRNGTQAGVKVKGANGLGSGRFPRSQGREVSVSVPFLTEPPFLGPQNPKSTTRKG